MTSNAPTDPALPSPSDDKTGTGAPASEAALTAVEGAEGHGLPPPVRKGGLYDALRGLTPIGSGLSAAGMQTGVRVTEALGDILAKSDPADVAALVQQLNALLPQIELAQSGIAALEARSDRDVGALVQQAAEIRESLLALEGEARADAPKDLPALLLRFNNIRAQTAELRRLALQDEQRFVEREGTEKASLVTARGAAAAQVFDAELALRKGEAAQIASLGGAAVETEVARIAADAEMQRVRAKGRAAAIEAALVAQTAELKQGLAVAAVGAEAGHRADTQRQVAEQRAATRDAILPPTVAAAEESEDRVHRLNMSWLNRLNGGTPMYVALIAQVVSAYLSTKGVQAMSQHSDDSQVASLVLPIGVAASLNLFMLYLTFAYHNHGWDFSVRPFKRDRDGSFGIPKDTINTGLYFGTALATTMLGTAGAATEFVPGAVIGTAIEEPVAEARAYVTDQKGVVDAKVSAPTAEAVQRVLESGVRLVDESLGRGMTGVYGFKGESIARLGQYRTDVTATVNQLTALGACDAVGQVRIGYEHTMNVLQAEYDRNPSFASAPFVTVGSGGVVSYDLDLNTQSAECGVNHPDAPADLVKQVDAELKALVNDVKGGAVTDTSELNTRVFKLNELMSKIQAATGNKAPELHEFDPMFVEAIRILLQNIGTILSNPQEHVAAWPFILAALAAVIDQVGMLIAIVSRGAKEGQAKLVAERLAALGTTGVDIDALKKRRGRLLEFLDNLKGNNVPPKPPKSRP